MRERSWRWGSARILGLLSAPVTGWARIPIDDGKRERVIPLWRYRVQDHFYGVKEA